MRTALIGFTGFVGSNLDSQFSFTDKYNSKNISDIKGKSYDLVVSAATRAEMWRINQEPDKDLAEIKDLMSHLKTMQTKQFVLISTVGVYKEQKGVDEDTPIETDGLLPYGVNRYLLERFCRQNFDTLIVRLPGLFGPGLKKNVIFDLLHNNNIDRIHSQGVYQYYNLEYLWKDINIALSNNLELVNFATEPLQTSELAKKCFGIEFVNQPADVQPAHFDMHSKYAEFFEGSGHYLYNKQQEIDDIRKYIKQEGSA